MCLSPRSSGSNINSFFKSKNNNKNISKEDNENKLFKKRLSSRNNEIVNNPKKFIYRKIFPKNLIQFSSNNSTSSNTSYLNNVKTHNKKNGDFESGYKNQNYLQKKIKSLKRQDYSNILIINNAKDKIKNIFQKYKKNTYNHNIRGRHNRSLSKNLNQDLVISKIVDKLVIDNINKINNYNNNLNSQKNIFDIEKKYLSSNISKEYNSYLKTNSKKDINFPVSSDFKKIKSKYDINSLVISRHSALASSINIKYSKNTSRQVKSFRSNSPKTNDNNKKKKNSKNNCGNNKKTKIIKLCKSKNIINNISFNNYLINHKNYSNDIGFNNNKIEYVQINLFSNGHEEKTSNRKNNILIKNEKEITSSKNINKKNIKNSKEKQTKLFDDINRSNDALYMTKSFSSSNNKNRKTNDLSTPEENHFLAINYAQLIKNNNKSFF